MKFCIHCGARLPQAVPPIIKSPQIVHPPSLPLTTKPQKSYTVISKPEIANMSSDITVLIKRKVALLELFKSGNVSERIIIKLYSEYNEKLRKVLNIRLNKMKELNNEEDKKNKSLKEILIELEEIEVRKKIQEIDNNTYNQRVESFKAKELELKNSIKTLKINQNILKEIFTEKSSQEIQKLEVKLKSFQSFINKLIEEGGISKELLNTLKPDIKETLVLLTSFKKNLEDKEENLKKKL
jgi:hypothetical protein